MRCLSTRCEAGFFVLSALVAFLQFHAMKITVPQSWRELTEWQLEEIADIYLSADPADFGPALQKMIFMLLQNRPAHTERQKLYRVLENVDPDELLFHAEFLMQTTTLHFFPVINGLTKPADRMANLTAKQFSFADKFFYDYEQDKSEVNLRRFVASLYTFGEFNQLQLPAVAEVTGAISLKKCRRIALAYKFTQLHIWNSYPVIFPKREKTEEDAFTPVFEKKPVYQTFDKVILGLVFSEEQPLGTKLEADNTLLYDFLNVWQESFLRYEEKKRQHAKSN